MPTTRTIYVDHDVASATAGSGTVGDPFSRWWYAIEQEHALTRDYATLDEELHIVCRGQLRSLSSVWTVPDFGARLDATRRLILRAADDAKHDGIYDSASYFTLSFTTAASPALRDSERMRFWTVRDMQGRVANSSTSAGAFSLSWGRWERCIFSREGRSAGTPTGGNCFGNTAAANVEFAAISCLFIGSWLRSVFAVANASANVVIYNCTSVGGVNGFVVTQNAGTPTMRLVNNRVERNAAWGGDAYILSGADISTATNMSDDATSPQAALRTLAGTFVDASVGNYRPVSPDPGIGEGTNLSADATFPFAYELAGGGRSVPWDIGARTVASVGIVASTLRFVSQPVATDVGDPLPSFAVEAWDDDSSARDVSFTGTVSLNATGTVVGAFTGSLSVSLSAGLSTFSLIVPLTLGTFTFTATCDGLAAVDSDTFAIGRPLTGGGGDTFLFEETMITPVLRNAVAPEKRVVLLRVRNADGSPWSGSVTGVKPLLAGVPLADDIIRLAGDLHGAQLSQSQSNVTVPYLYITLPADGTRLFASGVGLVSGADATVAAMTEADQRNGAIALIQSLQRTNHGITLRDGADNPVLMPIMTDPTLQPIATISEPE